MPNRVIRDGLLDSEAILTCPTEARWLFLTICLQADDIGFFEATPFKLARKADLDVKLTGKLLLLLAEEDLIRPYTHEGKQYGFIPRFRQRIQVRKLKFPLPPKCIYEDDPDAAQKIAALHVEEGPVGAYGKDWEVLRLQVFERDGKRCLRCGATENLTAHHLTPKSEGGKHEADNLCTLCNSCNAWARNNKARCNEIKDLVRRSDTGQILPSNCSDTAQRPEAEAEAEYVLHPSTKDVVDDASAPPTKTRKTKAQTLGQYVVPDCPYSEVVALYHEHLPMLRRVDIISEQRKRHLQARWRAVCADIKGDKAAGLDWFSWFFKRVAESKFLTGKVASRDADKAPFTAHFDWLMTPEKFIRVCEGFYNR